MNNQKLKGVLFTMLATVLMSFSPVLAKLSYYDGGSTAVFMSFTMGVAAIVAATLMMGKKISFTMTKEETKGIVIVGLASCAAIYTFLKAASYITTAATTAIHFFYPAMVLIVSMLKYHYKMTWIKTLSVLFCMTGAGLFFETGGTNQILGSLLALASAVVYVVYVMASDHLLPKDFPPMKATFYISVVSMVSIALCGLLTGTLTLPASQSAWTNIVLNGIIIEVFAVALLQSGIKKAGATFASFASTLEVVNSIVLGYLVFHDAVTLRVFFGCVALCIGIILNALGAAKDGLEE